MRGRTSEVVDATSEILTHRTEQMPVPVQRHHNRRVAEHVLDELRVSAGLDGDGGGRMPKVMDAGEWLSDARSPHGGVPDARTEQRAARGNPGYLS